MARLIDADRFIKWLDVGHLRHPSEVCLSELDVKRMIDLQPTIEAEPVRTAHWIKGRLMSYEWNCPDIYYACPRCEAYYKQKYDYCPHCGSKMEEKL